MVNDGHTGTLRIEEVLTSSHYLREVPVHNSTLNHHRFSFGCSLSNFLPSVSFDFFTFYLIYVNFPYLKFSVL